MKKNEEYFMRGYTPLLFAAADGEFDVVAYMLEDFGVDAKDTDIHGNNILHIVISKIEPGHENAGLVLIPYLVGKGVDLNAANKAGITPAQLAETKGLTKICDAIKSAVKPVVAADEVVQSSSPRPR